MSIEKKIIYFEKPGSENTSDCFEVVKNALRESKYMHLIVASTSGDTGSLFSEALKNSGINLIVVTHSSGFKEPNTTEMPEDVKKKIENSGAKVFTGSITNCW